MKHFMVKRGRCLSLILILGALKGLELEVGSYLDPHHNKPRDSFAIYHRESSLHTLLSLFLSHVSRSLPSALRARRRKRR
jgi:hypothetical protein